MSFESDQRVVELQFNNKQFEANVSTTISTLDKLQNKLKFEGAAKGFQELEKASRDVKFDELASNIERLTSGLTTVGGEIKRRIREGIVNTLESTAKSTIKSMTMLDQLGVAWEKYGRRTGAVQTIMAATASQFADESKQLEVVEGQLDRLSWFTDETSYAFTDMVDNIGKFTSSGVKLDSAVNNMMGIATWAAVSGANAQVASGAMRELAQAIGSGVVMTKDWQSIETANMATAEFKQTVLDTAASLGQLRKTGDGVYQTAKGTLVTVQNFRNTLSEKWFTGQVLENALNRYGEFASKLGDAYNMIVDGGQAADFTTSKLIRLIEQHSQGNLDIAKTAAEYNVSASELQKTLDTLASSEMELGLKSFKAAQEAKTFGEVIDSVKEAVASGWMESFNIIVGNYNEAKEMFTSLSEYLYDIFNGGAEARNEMLQAWKDNGGRDAILESFKNLAAAVESVVAPIKDAFRDIFPPMTGEKLAELTRRFQNFTSHLKLSEEAAEGVRRVFSVIFSVVGKFVNALKLVGKGALFTIAVIKTLVDYFFSWIGGLEGRQSILSKFTTKTNLLSKALSILGIIVSAPIVAIGALGVQISKFIQHCKNSENIQMLYGAFSSLIGVLKSQAWDKFSKIQVAFAKLIGIIRPYLPTVNQLTASFNGFKSTLSNIPRYIAAAVIAFAEFLRSGNKLSTIANLFKTLGAHIIGGLQLGIQTGLSFLTDIGSKMFNVIRVAFMNAAGIHSPSLVMKSLGILCAAGVVLGIAGYYGEARKAGLDLFSAILEGANSSGIKLPEALSRILQLFSEGSKVLGQYLGPFDEFIARFFKNLTAGQVIMIAFTVMLGTFVKRVNKVTDSVSGLFTAIASPFKALSGGMTKIFTALSKSIKSFTKTIRANVNANNWLKIAGAMAIMSVSIIALSWACRDENMTYIIRAGAVIGGFAVMLGILMAIGTSLAKASDGSFTKISLNVVAIAFAIITLARAMAIMSKLATESPGKVVGMILEFVLACAGLVTVVAMMNKYAKDGVKGSLALIAIANAIKITVKAISSAAKELNGIKNIMAAVGVFGLAVVAIAGLAKFMDGVEFGGGFGLIATMLALRLAVEVLEAIIRQHKALVDSGAMVSMKELWPDIAAIAGLMLAAATALRIAGDATLKAGIGVILACAALKIAINTLANITGEADFAKIQAWIATLMPLFRDIIMAMGLWTTVAAFFSTMNVSLGKFKFRTGNAKGLLRAFIGFAAAIVILVGAMKLMEYLDQSKIEESTILLTELMLMFGVASAMAGLAKGAHQAIAKMTGVIIALTGCLAFLSLFIQEGQELSMLVPALSLAGALVSLGIALWGAGKITEEVKMAPIIAMLIGALEIGVIMNALAQYDWPALISAGGGLALALVGFSGAMWIASKASDGIKFFNTVQMMLILGEVATAMYFLSGFEWQSIAAAAGGLSIAMLSIAGAMRIASEASASITGAAAFLIMTASLIPAAYAVSMLTQYDWVSIAAAAGALSITALLLATSMRIASADASASIAGAASFLIMAVSLIPAAYAISMLAQYNWGSITAACLGLVGSVLILTSVGQIIGGAIVGGGWMFLLAFAAAIAVLGAALLLFVQPAVNFANAVTKLGPAVRDMVAALSELQNVDTAAVAAASNVIQTIGQTLIEGARGLQPQVSSAMFIVGTSLSLGLVNGVGSTLSTVYSAGEKMGEAAELGIRDQTDTNSPSGLFKKIGKFFAQGLVEGIGDSLVSIFQGGSLMGSAAVEGASSTENLNAAEKAGTSLGSKVLEGLKNVWEKIKKWFSDNFKVDLGEAISDPAAVLTEALGGENGALGSLPKTIEGKYKEITKWFEDPGGFGGSGALGNIEMPDIEVPDVSGLTSGLGDLSNSMGGVGKSGKGLGKSMNDLGDSANDTTEDMSALYDVMTYAANAVGYFYDNGDQLLKLYDKTTPWNNAIKSTQDLILEHYKLTNLYDDEIQAIQSFGDMNVDHAKAAKEAWEDYYNTISNSISKGFGGVFTAPTFSKQSLDVETTSFRTMMDNLDAQERQMTYFTNTLIKLKREGLNDVYLQGLLEAGPENLSEIISWDRLTAEEIKKINAQYEKIQNATSKLTMDYITATSERFQTLPERVEESIRSGIMNMSTYEIQQEVYNRTTDILQEVLDADGDWEKYNGTRLGELLAEGLADGIKSTTDVAVEAVRKLAQEMFAKLDSEAKKARADQMASMADEWNRHVQSVVSSGGSSFSYGFSSPEESTLMKDLKHAIGFMNYYDGMSKNYDPDYEGMYRDWALEGWDPVSHAKYVLEDADQRIFEHNLGASTLKAQLEAGYKNLEATRQGLEANYEGSVTGSLSGGYKVEITQNNYSSENLNAEKLEESLRSVASSISD